MASTLLLPILLVRMDQITTTRINQFYDINNNTRRNWKQELIPVLSKKILVFCCQLYSFFFSCMCSNPLIPQPQVWEYVLCRQYIGL